MHGWTECKVVLNIFRFALKLLDKKRIKAKKGEILAVNERNMLAKVTLTLYTISCFTACDCSYTGQQSIRGQPILRIPNK